MFCIERSLAYVPSTLAVMNKWLNIILLTLFVHGVAVYPALHKVACAKPDAAACHCPAGCPDGDREPARHDSEQCPVCHLAGMPLLVSVPLLAPVFIGNVLSSVFPMVVTPSPRALRLLPFSRGPPA
jgi:hypothetical protein